MTTDEQLLKADIEARTEALDVSRSFIVQAPAGSGKTELLIQRYLNLLSVVENPEEVVAITFTRKAAAEMQIRVLESLRRRLSADEPDEDHERRTYELAGRALERSESLGWNLIGNPRRMRILTLDALNASIARSQPLTSPGTGARIVVGAELQSVYRAAALATLDWLAESGELQQATKEVLLHVDNNTWLYASYLSQMLSTRDQWLPFVGAGRLSDADAIDLRAKFEESLEYSVEQHLHRAAHALRAVGHEDLCELADYAATNLIADGSTEGPIARLAGIVGLPAPKAGETGLWQGIADLLLTQKGQFRKKVDKRQGFPPGDKARKDAMHGLLEDVSDDDDLATVLFRVVDLPPVQYTDEQWRVLLALFRLLPLAVIELQRLFGERAICDHINVALTASAALGTAENPGDIALLLDYQVKHLLVDEMQDTSAAQYRMLETLTGGWEPGDGRSLYCVGDPMQSIYRFRNAEVGQFLLAREFGIGHIRPEPLLLRRNFRSGAWLVDWFNTVFPTIFAPRDDPLRGAVSYSDAVPVEHLQGQGTCVTHAVFGADTETEALAGCRLIGDTLRANPNDEMAVLVRGRTQLPQLLAYLRKAKIRYRAVEIDRLTDLPEVIEVLALTRAAAHQGDRIAWLGLLRAPWIGLQWSDLHALVRNDNGRTVWELLQDEERLLSISADGRTAIEKVRGTLASLIAPRLSQSLRDLVERAWFALGGPGILDDDYAIDNVYRYFDVLQKLEHAGTLVDVGELESTLDLERVSSNENARLQIMTMHRAKGLQFDHVLLFGLGRQPGHGDRRVMSWFDLPVEHGTERKVISPVGPRSVLENDPVHRYIELTEADKGRQEQARLLYVACTRAKKSLHLMGHTQVAPNGDSYKPARNGSLLHLLWPAVEPEFERQFAAQQVSPRNETAAIWVNPPLRRLSSDWTLPDADLLPGESMPGEQPVESNEVEFYWVGTDARIAGTLVHRWLQLIADEFASGRGTEQLALREITTRWLSETGIESTAAAPIRERVSDAVSAMLNDEKGRWILQGLGYTELALTGVSDGELISVVLDRVRIDADGTHWIIDYKTSSHEGGNLDGFLQAEADRYQSQLARYASIYREWAGEEVRCALYFPLLTTFVEVPA
jgi:ATP-dependent exoDNAse (exonuclease V) beta subunit